MSFIAVLLALMLEQARPLATANPVHGWLRDWARWMAAQTDAGETHHGWLTWALAVGVPAAAALIVHLLLIVYLGALAAVVWSVVILYLTLGFRQFSHHFTGIRDTLEAGDEVGARERLARWRRVDTSAVARTELLRHVIEYSVIAAHRHVFGVLFWHCVLAGLGLGPTGAVLYRMAEFASRFWRDTLVHNARAEPASDALQEATASAWYLIDWLPARATALAFAVVGSFEEAMEGWRHHAAQGAVPSAASNDRIIIAATSGAINVRLGGEALRPRGEGVGGDSAFGTTESGGLNSGAGLATSDSTSTPGRTPELGHLRAVVGLVWRTVVLWMLLLALLTLAQWLA